MIYNSIDRKTTPPACGRWSIKIFLIFCNQFFLYKESEENSVLTIIYRAYPGVSKRPLLNFSDKYEQMNVCLESLARQLHGISFEFIFIDDGCTEKQVNLVIDRFSGSAVKFEHVQLDKIGNQGSFRESVLAARRAKFDVLLFLEDDYYISDEDVSWNIAAISSKEADYSTFYYQNDSEWHVGNMCLPVSFSLHNGCQATLLPSTTLTFFANRSILLEDQKHFLAFCDGVHDSSLWIALTGSFFHFIKNLGRPLFRNNLRLVASILKHYARLRVLFRLSPKSRSLAFIGGGRTFHLESTTMFDKFSACKFAYDYKSRTGEGQLV